jgi:chitobiase/beta-hexosaminidase-like protein
MDWIKHPRMDRSRFQESIMNKFLFIAAILLLFARSAFAQGACPSGANYVNPTAPVTGNPPTLNLVTLASMGITGNNCWYFSSSGSSSNTGTTESSPCLYLPGMPNAPGSGSCHITPAAGQAFIVEGGSHYHFGNSAATPYIGGHTWAYSGGGSSGAYVYIGVDHAWFIGGSYARPILDQDNPLSTNQVSSCSFPNDSGGGVTLSGDYIYFDDFELTGDCWTSASNQELNASGSHTIRRHLYFHGWTTTTSLNDDERAAIGGGFTKGQLTQLCDFNVFDGSDSSLGTGGTFPNGTDTRSLIENTCNVVSYSVFHRINNGIVGTVTSVHDNLFYDVYEHGSNPHGNLWNSNMGGSETTCSTNGINQYLYNNIAHEINEGVTFWPQPCAGTGYIFGNVVWNIKNGVNCILLGSGSANTPAVLYFYNNTFDASYVDSNGEHCQIFGETAGHGNPIWNGTVHFINNHFIAYTGITTGGTTVVSGCGSFCAWTDDNSATEIFQTETIANGQGYVPGNIYAPTLNTNATVSAGTNETSLCSTFSSDSELCAARVSVSEVAGEGGMIAQLNSANARPAGGAWDTGAYEFNSAPPSASTPTCTPGTQYIANPISVTCSTVSGGAIICYTVNGSTPATNGAAGCMNGILYSGAITIPITTTLTVIAGGTGFTDSGTAAYTYTVVTAPAAPMLTKLILN